MPDNGTLRLTFSDGRRAEGAAAESGCDASADCHFSLPTKYSRHMFVEVHKRLRPRDLFCP
jgi:hypothetical protein